MNDKKVIELPEDVDYLAIRVSEEDDHVIRYNRDMMNKVLSHNGYHPDTVTDDEVRFILEGCYEHHLKLGGPKTLLGEHLFNKSAESPKFKTKLQWGAVVKPKSAKQIKELRDHTEMTQPEVARLLGLSNRQLIGDYENENKTPNAQTYTLWLILTGQHPTLTVEPRTDRDVILAERYEVAAKQRAKLKSTSKHLKDICLDYGTDKEFCVSFNKNVGQLKAGEPINLQLPRSSTLRSHSKHNDKTVVKCTQLVSETYSDAELSIMSMIYTTDLSNVEVRDCIAQKPISIGWFDENKTKRLYILRYEDEYFVISNKTFHEADTGKKAWVRDHCADEFYSKTKRKDLFRNSSIIVDYA